jgi:hypothetical protein
VTSSSGRRMWSVSSPPMVAQLPREVAADVLRYHAPGDALGSMVLDEQPR